ncbi:MAG: flagellar basal body P-ring formation chaperone FlgA [Rickettsiales bacterium]|nr:flagellar basal body P-ring formation chaperone FlgA [Rickettsiales bacterium]
MKKHLLKSFLFLALAFVAFGNILASDNIEVKLEGNSEYFSIKELSKKTSEIISANLENKLYGVKYGYITREGTPRNFTFEEVEKSGIDEKFKISKFNINREFREFEIVLSPESEKYFLSAKGKFTESKKVIVAGDLIKKGEAITQEKLSISYVPEEKFIYKALNEYDSLIGKIATKNINLGMQITENDIENPIIIKKGKAVLAIFKIKNMEVKVTAMALSDGRQGEIIRLKNIESGKEFTAMVDKPNVVIANFNSNSQSIADNGVRKMLTN